MDILNNLEKRKKIFKSLIIYYFENYYLFLYKFVVLYNGGLCDVFEIENLYICDLIVFLSVLLVIKFFVLNLIKILVKIINKS